MYEKLFVLIYSPCFIKFGLIQLSIFCCCYMYKQLCMKKKALGIRYTSILNSKDIHLARLSAALFYLFGLCIVLRYWLLLLLLFDEQIREPILAATDQPILKAKFVSKKCALYTSKYDTCISIQKIINDTKLIA